MSFGSDLQGWQSHEALLKVQDYEVHLIEEMRKCIHHRAKCDRDYVASLSSIIGNIIQKQNEHAYGDGTPFGQVKQSSFFRLVYYEAFVPVLCILLFKYDLMLSKTIQFDLNILLLNYYVFLWLNKDF